MDRNAGEAHAEDYAARGRAHRDLSLEALGRRWAAAFRAAVRSPGRRDLRTIERDLSAEFKLRNVDPPYHDVEEERERLIAEIAEQLEMLRTSLPDDFALIQAAAFDLARRAASPTSGERMALTEPCIATARDRRRAALPEPTRSRGSRSVVAGLEKRGGH